MSQGFEELDAFMDDLARLPDEEEAVEEAVRKIKAEEVDWLRVLQPLAAFAGQYWKGHTDEIRAALKTTAADEEGLGKLPPNNGPASTIVARNIFVWISNENPTGKLVLSLALRIAWHVSDKQTPKKN